jgi:hypothetical protein
MQYGNTAFRGLVGNSEAAQEFSCLNQAKFRHDLFCPDLPTHAQIR